MTSDNRNVIAVNISRKFYQEFSLPTSYSIGSFALDSLISVLVRYQQLVLVQGRRQSISVFVILYDRCLGLHMWVTEIPWHRIARER